jgi:TatD DNase family protein
MLFDTHCHLQLSQFADDRAEVLARAREAGVARVLNLATSIRDAQAVIDLAREHPGQCMAAVGTHPSHLEDWSEEAGASLAALSELENLPVFGEIGIDYFHNHHPREFQREVFRRQLAIARSLGLPVSMHCREAYDDLIADLEAESGAKIGGVAHCFMGTLEQAKRLIAMGFMLGVGGSATYPKSTEVRDVLRTVGAEHLILETDAPYLSPQTKRGKRNEPAYVAETARLIARELGLEMERLAEITTQNAERAFRLKP